MCDYFSEAVRKVNELSRDEHQVWITKTNEAKVWIYKDFCRKACELLTGGLL